jgi:glycosyltransferase involved in cell wall biosynthesis
LNLPKKKILWVVFDFNQAGGQRYVYEICKALNKEKYDIDVLKITPMGSDKSWDKEFYYRATLDLGCNIFFLEDVLKSEAKNLNRINKLLKKISVNNFEDIVNKQNILIKTLLSNYDHINFSGLNAYKNLCISRCITPQNAIIHILTAKFQDSKNIYEGFDKTFNYNFVSSFSDDILRYELKGFINYRHTYYPLCLATIPFNVSWIEKKDKKFVIAVFSRLSSMKPLDPYFYALKLLLEKGLDIKLQIYGAGNPEGLGLIRQLNYLHISDKVEFRGHVESIPGVLTNAGIDLVWFQSNNHLPAGYAALEIALSGIPQIFWNFSDIGLEKPVGKVFPCFTSLTDFVHTSENLLKSTDLRNNLGLKQKEYVIKNNSSNTHIHILEKLFDNDH